VSLSSIATALEAAALAATSATVALDDPFARVQGPTAGVTALSVLALPAGYDLGSDSNQTYLVALFEIAVVHRLADPNDEAAYVEGAMRTDQVALLDPSLWEVAGVYEVAELPGLEADRDRVGRAIVYRISAQLRFIP